MAADPSVHPIALRPPANEAAARARLQRATTAHDAVETRISHQLAIAIPAINIGSAILTSIFIVYVAPLAGHGLPAHARTTWMISAGAAIGAGWLTCHLWGKRAFAPVRAWLRAGGDPDEAQRARTIRLPLHLSGHSFAVWLAAAAGLSIGDVAAGASAVTGMLVAVIIVIGGTVAYALSYFATEWIMRPAVALALTSDPPVRAVLPGIKARMWLAWEFGTASAVAGMLVVTTAYLAGSHISPRRMAATVIFLGAIALTVGLLTLLVAIKSVALPVRRLRRAMAQLERGDTDIMLPIDDGGEIGLLQAGFNRMVAGLRERDQVRELFGRHVGEEVARAALARGLELGGELREAAVLFVDVVGSTAFAATHDPREVVETLNRCFAIVVDVVTLYGGWVNKFEGDAALCVFGAPTDHPDAAGAALAAARALRRRLCAELPELDAAIGLSAGTVVAGNVGAAQRYEYTVIGDPVNEAARLTELAKAMPSRLLASESIVARAGGSEAVRWEYDGQPVLLRGRARATRIATAS